MGEYKMPKLEDAAIPMLTGFENVEFITPLPNQDYEQFLKRPALQPFDEHSIRYLDALSKLLYQNPLVRNYPDVATFAFYCRRANLLQLQKGYNNEHLRLGRGIVFHIAPSNVPVNFAYSLVAGLLAGNSNIVRVSSKDFDQVNIISQAIVELSKNRDFEEISSRIVLVKYDRANVATKKFSAICDIRVIWGGDETITQIRQNPIPPRSFDITFADRYSLAVINADEYIHEKSPNKIAQGFYNDTYLFDQNACTSPQLVIWMGDANNVAKSKEIFWNALYEIAKEKYLLQPIRALDKITSFFNQAVNLSGIRKTISPDNLLWRIELEELNENIDQYTCSSGYFAEYHADSFAEITPIVNRKYQTMAYYGFDKKVLGEMILLQKPSGIDRIVPIGRTMEFSVIWDGYDLICTLSRAVDIH
jgi:hypothetical protein